METAACADASAGWAYEVPAIQDCRLHWRPKGGAGREFGGSAGVQSAKLDL